MSVAVDAADRIALAAASDSLGSLVLPALKVSIFAVRSEPDLDD